MSLLPVFMSISVISQDNTSAEDQTVPEKEENMSEDQDF